MLPVGGEGRPAQGAAAVALALERDLGRDVQEQQVGGAAEAGGQAGQEAAAPAAGTGVVDDQARGARQGEQHAQEVLGVDQRAPDAVRGVAEEALVPGPDRLRVEDPGAGGVDAREQGRLPGSGDAGHDQQGRRGQTQPRRVQRDVALGRFELHHVGDVSGPGGKPG